MIIQLSQHKEYSYKAPNNQYKAARQSTLVSAWVEAREDEWAVFAEYSDGDIVCISTHETEWEAEKELSDY